MRRRQTVPAWVPILVLMVVGALIMAPGPASQAEALGNRLLAPLQFGLARALSGIGHLVETVNHAGQLTAQNQTYRDEIDRLQSMLVQMRELELENEDLRRLLDLRRRAPGGSLLSVNVIAQDPLSIVQSVTVDRGSDDGVAVDAPVITWRGLVGRVVEVHPTSAKVLLLTDVNSAVSARIQEPSSRATGLIRGVGDGRLLLQFVPRTDTLRTGDLVITSGIGGGFPPGLVVGTILQARQRDVDVFQEALVEPSVDVRNLERLYILLRAPQPSRSLPD